MTVITSAGSPIQVVSGIYAGHKGVVVRKEASPPWILGGYIVRLRASSCSWRGKLREVADPTGTEVVLDAKDLKFLRQIRKIGPFYV